MYIHNWSIVFSEGGKADFSGSEMPRPKFRKGVNLGPFFLFAFGIVSAGIFPSVFTTFGLFFK